MMHKRRADQEVDSQSALQCANHLYAPTQALTSAKALVRAIHPKIKAGNTCLLAERRAGPCVVRLVAEARRYARRVVLEPTPKLRRGNARASGPREGMANWLRRRPKAGSECAVVAPKVTCAWGRIAIGFPEAFLSYVLRTGFPKVRTGYTSWIGRW